MAKEDGALKVKEAWETEFEPYAKAVGFLLRDWNDLQGTLCDLFVTVTGGQEGGIMQSVWHSVPVDRLQRNMLRQAASYRFRRAGKHLNDQQKSDNAYYAEIEWVVDNADAVGRQRDDAAHVPVAMLLSSPVEFIARTFQGNPIAQKLTGKRLLDEFTHYRARARVLRAYARDLEQFLRYERTWTFPKRPSLPAPPQSSGGTDRNRQGSAKQPKPRRKS